MTGDLGADIYRGVIHPKDQQVLNELTSPRAWDWQRFRRVLIALATLGHGNYITAPNRPDSIHLQGLRQTINELANLSQERGKETSKVVFVDRQRQSLVISRKTAIGSETRVKMAVATEPSREAFQQRVISIHTHPNAETAHGLSDTDYVSFIPDPQELVMIMVWEGGSMLALKTTATPNSISQKRVAERISSLRAEFFDGSTKPMLQRIVDLNKAVCIEFGLILFLAEVKDKDLLKRVSVTK